MKVKYVLLFPMMIVLLLCLCSCSQIEDTNGEDNYQLQTISDERIISGKGSTVKVGSVSTTINNKGTYKVKKFSGVETIFSIDGSNNRITLTIISEIKSGNFKIVLVNEKQIVKVFDLNCTQSVTIENATGRFDLKIAGESANFSIEYEKNIE